MRLLARGLGAALLLAAVAAPAPTAHAADGHGHSPRSFTIKDPRITESSGLAASRAHPGVFWTHNDSDDGPYVYAVDSATGRTVATVTLAGIKPRDVEAISVGPDGQVYVGDIGDNLDGSWSEVWIYRFPEPRTLRDTTVTPVRYTVRYDDGPRDAESLMVHPRSGRVWILSKNEKGGRLYEGPKRLSASGVNTFRRRGGVDVWATDAAFSPDGTRLVVRGYFDVAEYRWAEGRKPRPIGRPEMPLQRQGESVTFTRDGRALMYGTEGADSRVGRVELRGDLLPESAAKHAAPDGKARGTGGTGGSTAPGSGDSGGTGGKAAGDTGQNAGGTVTLGGAALVVAVIVLLLGARSRGRRR